MKRKSWKEFHRDLSWATRIYTLATILLIGGAFMFDAWSGNWALTIVAAVAVLLFFETFAISFYRHPRTWRVIRWVLILLLFALILTG